MDSNLKLKISNIPPAFDQATENSLFKTNFRVFNYDEEGCLINESLDHNATVLGGRVAALELAFKSQVQTPQHHTLNDLLTIPAGAMGENDWYSRKASYFCVGVGGVSSLSPLALAKPTNKETTLYDIVPLRLRAIGNDLSEAEKANYRLRKIIEIEGTNYIAYYAKKFDPGQINLQNVSGTDYIPSQGVVDIPVDPGASEADENSVLTYNRFSLFVGNDEFKEWWKITHDNSLTGAAFSETGIIYGLDVTLTDEGGNDYTEIKGAELFGKIVHSPSYLDQEGNSKVIVYEIFT